MNEEPLKNAEPKAQEEPLKNAEPIALEEEPLKNAEPEARESLFELLKGYSSDDNDDAKARTASLEGQTSLEMKGIEPV